MVEDWDAAVADPRGCAIADAGYRVADIKSERWPASRRNGWPASVGIRNKRRYRERWRIEATFNRLKDFRRIATRYDKLARNYASALALAAVIAFWC